MHFPGNIQRYPALLLGLAQIGIIWLLSIAGGFELLNGLLYDGLYAWQPSSKNTAQVVLLEADNVAARTESALWLNLLQQISAQNVKPVVFTFMPEQAPPAFYQLAAQIGVIFARRPLADSEAPEAWRWQQLPAQAEPFHPLTALLPPPPQRHGVYDSHWLHVDRYGEQGPSPFWLATRGGAAGDAMADERFYLNLAGGSARLFRLPLSQALHGGLVAELLQGKALLVGIRDDNEQPTLYTPAGPVTAAVYDGLALDSLLRGIPVRHAGWEFLPAAALLLAAASLFIYQSVPLRQGLWVGLGLSLLYIFSAWCALHYAAFWPPLAELLLLQALASILIYRQLILAEQRHLREMLALLEIKLLGRSTPAAFYQTEDHWLQVIDLVRQLFDLRRTIFLERIAGDHRLKEIQAFNCSLHDIDEKRRDYERSPYSSAIAENGPIQLDQQFLKQAGEQEVQFLVPLIFAGEVLGFWALSVLPARLQNVPGFSAMLGNFAEQLSQMLHYRREWRRRRQIEQDPLRSYLRLEAGATLSQNLRKSVALLDQRLGQLQDIFDELRGGCILYDLFGRVLMINRQMEQLAQAEAIKPFERPLADLLAELTAYPLSKVTGLLQHVIFHGGELQIPINLHDQRFMMLTLKPLHADLNRDDLGQAGPFYLQGVLFELNDASRFKTLSHMKDEVIARIFYRLRNDLGSMLLTTGLLERSDLPDAQRKQIAAAVKEKIESMSPLLEQMQTRLTAGLDKLLEDNLAHYPVDGLAPLCKAVTHAQEKRPDIKLQLRIPALISLVLAAPTELADMLRDILDVMTQDTVHDGDLVVRVEESPSAIFYRFRNTGFGLPPERLAAYLESRATETDAPYARLHRAMEHARLWGGEMSIQSELGEGMRIQLTLKPFLSQTP